MHILLVKLSAIGDIIHALPSLLLIKQDQPTSTVSWVAESRSAEILRGNQLIDNLIEIDTRALRGGRLAEDMLIDAAKQARGLRKFDYDVAIDLQGLFKSAFIAKLSGATKRWGFAKKDLREPGSRFLLTETVPIPDRTHVVHKNLILTAAAIGADLSDAPIEFPIFTSSEDRAEAEAIIARTGGDYAILNPAGGWVTKLWHAEKYGELADILWDRFGLMPIVATGPAENELAAKVMASSRTGRAIDVQPSLKAFYELARRAKIYIGGDTGPTHLAIAAGAPVVGIFGPTEWWRNGSTNNADICVGREDIACRVDCHRRTCYNWVCMDISSERVAEAVGERLAKAYVAR